MNAILLTVLIVSLSIFVYSLYYMKEEANYNYFMVVLSSFILSMMILLLSNSLILMFLGWDLLGITSFFLVMYYSNWKSLNNSFITFLSNKVGDVMFILLFSYVLYSWSYVSILSGLILFLLSITKSAQFPFSSWLCAAMSAPTPVSALVHSSTLVTAGVVIIMKFLNYNLYGLLFKVGLLTIFLSGVNSLVEMDFKKLVALSTLSQMGMLFLTLGMYNYYMTSLHLMSHAYFKSLLFLLVGSYLHYNLSLQDSRKYTLSTNMSLLSYTLLTISLLSLCSIFFLSGFFSKDLIYESFLMSKEGMILLFIFWLALIFTLFYSYKMVLFTLSISFNTLSYKSISFQLTGSVLFLTVLAITFSHFYINNYLPMKLFPFFWEKYLLMFQLLIFLIFFKVLTVKPNLQMDGLTNLVPITLLKKDYEKSLFEPLNLHLYNSVFSVKFLFVLGFIILFFIP